MKKAQKGAVVKKTTVKKKSSNPADSYPANRDKRGIPTIGGGEGRRPPMENKADIDAILSGKKKLKNGGTVNYKGAAGAVGLKGSGTYKPGAGSTGSKIGKLSKCRGGC